MKILLSPAKTFNKDLVLNKKSKPKFINKTNYLLNILKSYSINDLKNNLKISTNLANNVFNYYKDFEYNIEAISLYGGTAFKYLNYKSINKNSLNNLFILSPLYGLVNAFDSISKYRLDIKDKILNESLYNYWKEDINNFLLTFNNELIVNLSSGEFSNLLDLENQNIITIDFKELKDGKLKSQSMMLKKMRGLFANYILNNNINTIDQLKLIEIDGFKYNKNLSNNKLMIFVK